MIHFWIAAMKIQPDESYFSTGTPSAESQKDPNRDLYWIVTSSAIAYMTPESQGGGSLCGGGWAGHLSG